MAQPPRDVYRRRRLGALGALAAVAALAGAAVGAGGRERGSTDGSSSASAGAATTHAAKAKPKPPPELPLGGRTIFPHYRVVAYYGAPQAHALGALGIGSPDLAGRRPRPQAHPYGKKTRPGLLPVELIVRRADPPPPPG